MRLAFVLTAKQQLPEASQVLAAWRAIVPNEPPLTADPASAGTQNVLGFLLRSATPVHVALMPAPVPNREADEAARFSVGALGTGWTLPEHNAHLMVVLQNDSKQKAAEAMRDLTRLAAAVAKASDAVGIYWGDGHATHRPELVIDLAAEELPIMLWTGVSVAFESPTRVSLLSLGMRQLDLPDLLLTAPRRMGNDALGMFFDLLSYLARREEPINDGETVGRSEEEHLVVRYVPSPIAEGQLVWRVEVPEGPN